VHKLFIVDSDAFLLSHHDVETFFCTHLCGVGQRDSPSFCGGLGDVVEKVAKLVGVRILFEVLYLDKHNIEN
jgi:hypothetical protein